MISQRISPPASTHQSGTSSAPHRSHRTGALSARVSGAPSGSGARSAWSQHHRPAVMEAFTFCMNSWTDSPSPVQLRRKASSAPLRRTGFLKMYWLIFSDTRAASSTDAVRALRPTIPSFGTPFHEASVSFGARHSRASTYGRPPSDARRLRRSWPRRAAMMACCLAVMMLMSIAPPSCGRRIKSRGRATWPRRRCRPRAST